MTDNPTTIEPTTIEPAEEVWIFGGTRISAGKKCHAWLPLGASREGELWFAADGSFVPGSEYTVRVVRTESKVTKYGRPTYHGQHSDNTVRAELEARHRAAETRLRLAALERSDKRHSALDAAVEPLCELIKSASMADRDAILAYVIRRLSRAW